MEDRLELIADHLEEISNGQDQTRIAEALESIASILYDINKKL